MNNCIKSFYTAASFHSHMPMITFAIKGRWPVEILETLLERGHTIPPDAIEIACEFASADHLRCLLLHGADVNSEKHVIFQLHYGENGETELFEMLLAAGIDLSDKWTDIFAAASLSGCKCGSCIHPPLQISIELIQIVSNAGAHILERLLKELPKHAATHLQDSLHLQKDAVKAVELAGFKTVQSRMADVCIGLQRLQLPALLTTLILEEACEPFARHLPMHYLWDVAVLVRHRNGIMLP
jgi:hypothetical protein